MTEKNDAQEPVITIKPHGSIVFNEAFDHTLAGLWNGAEDDKHGVASWMSAFLAAVPGWPVARVAELESWMKKHPRSHSCQASIHAKVPTPGFLKDGEWDETLQAEAGAEAWVTAIRVNECNIGPHHFSSVCVSHVLYSAVTDFWICIVPVADMLTEGIALQDVEKYLETDAGDAMLGAKGVSSVFVVRKGETAFVPSGMLPIIYYWGTKEDPPVGFVMQIPMFVKSWFTEVGEQGVQAIATWNEKFLNTQSKDIYKSRLASSAKFFTSCGAKSSIKE